MNLLKPKTPSLPAPPKSQAPPEVVDATRASDSEAERLRRRRGTASTILAGETSAAPGSVAVKTLLGQ